MVSEVIVLLAVFLSIVYVVGIVWRVESELDTSYKFFAFAITFFGISEIAHVYQFGTTVQGIMFEKGSKVLFAVLFLVGTLYMRDIVRKLDGEKVPRNKQ